MLRFAEEVLLLLVDEENGVVAFNYPPFLLDCVFASAVLMDLALEGRIDTDLEHLILVDPAPVGDSLLDPTLADIARGPVGRDADFWIERTAARGTEIRAESIARLVKAGILESGSDELVFLSRLVSRTRRYPPSDKKTQEDVRLRIMRALFTEDIPDPRDTMTICLADACGIIERLLSVTEREEVAERLELILKMDLIGQSLVRAIKRLKRPVAPPAASKEIPRASPWGFVAAVTGLGGGGTLALFCSNSTVTWVRFSASGCLTGATSSLPVRMPTNFLPATTPVFAHGKAGARFTVTPGRCTRSSAWTVPNIFAGAGQ